MFRLDDIAMGALVCYFVARAAFDRSPAIRLVSALFAVFAAVMITLKISRRFA